MPKKIKPSIEEISLAFQPANLKKFLLRKDQKSLLKYKGVETIAWDVNKDTFESYRDMYFKEMNIKNDHTSIFKNASRAMKEWIADKSLLGDPEGSSWSDVNNLPVVNPHTGKLNKEALEAVFNGSDVTEAMKNAAKNLLEKGFSKQDSMLQKVLSKFFKKGDSSMDKAKMIELLITDERYPFGKDDQPTLEQLEVKTLQLMVDMKKDGIDEAAIREKLTKELTKSLTKDLTKMLTEKITKDLKLSSDDKVKLLNDEIATFKTTIEKLTKEINDTKAMAMAEADVRKTMEFTQFIKDNNVPGDIEKLTKTMLGLSKGDPEIFKTYKESLQAAGAALTAAGVFSEVGGVGDGESSDSAYLQLQSLKVEAMKKDSNLTELKAWKAVIKGNSKLYQEYMAEKKEVK